MSESDLRNNDEYLFDDPRIKIPYAQGDMVTIEVAELAGLKAKEAMHNMMVERLDIAIAELKIPISGGDFKDDAIVTALRDAQARLVKISAYMDAYWSTNKDSPETERIARRVDALAKGQ